MPSARNRSYAASRSASANDQDSPWLAYPLAGRSPRVSVRSSRCGPTSVTPRSTSAGRRSASDASSACLERGPVRPIGDLAETGRYAIAGRARPAATASYALVTCGASAATSSSRPASSSAPCWARCVSQTSRVDRSSPASAADLAGQVRRPQQCVALLDHPVVVGPHPGVPRLPGDQQVVEVAPALGRVAADQFQVLRREQHHPQRAEHVAGPADRRTVEPGPVGLARHDLQLDQQLASVVDDRAADHRRRARRPGPAARRWRPGDCPGSPRSRAPRPGWSCRPRSGRRSTLDARVEVDRDPLVRAEVDQLEPADVHRAQLLWTAWPPNWLRSAATAFIAGESSCRDSKRANSEAAMTCIGTASRIASSTVQRPSPVSSA